MTFEEFGRIAKRSPEITSRYTEAELAAIPDRLFAMKALEAYPQYWDMVSPAARRIHALMAESSEPDYLIPFIHTNKVANQDRRDKVATIKMEVDALHSMEMVASASALGVPVETLAQVAFIREQTDAQIRLLQAQAEIQLETQRKTIELKLRFSEEEHNLRARLASSEPKRLKGASDGRQPGEVRGRAVPEADGEEVGEVEEAAQP